MCPPAIVREFTDSRHGTSRRRPGTILLLFTLLLSTVVVVLYSGAAQAATQAERVSIADDETQANGASTEATISGDGRMVAFRSSASNLVAGDTNGREDVFVRDIVTGTTTRINVSSDGAQSIGPFLVDGDLAISGDGRFVAFPFKRD